MTDAVRVVVCSSSSIIRLCVKVALEESTKGNYQSQLVAQVAGTAELNRHLVGSECPDVVLLHFHGTTRLPTVNAAVVVVFNEGEADGAVLLHILRNGVPNVVAIASDLDALPRACHLASAGLGYLSPALVRVLADHLAGPNQDAPSRYGLTPREVRVLKLLVTAAGMRRAISPGHCESGPGP